MANPARANKSNSYPKLLSLIYRLLREPLSYGRASGWRCCRGTRLNSSPRSQEGPMNEHVQLAYTALWSSHPVLETAVAIVMWRRHLNKQFPAFYAYLLWQILSFSVL